MNTFQRSNTHHLLKRLYQQKLHKRLFLGSGSAPAHILNMDLHKYLRRLGEIHFHLSKSLYGSKQPQVWNRATYMLKTLLPKLQMRPCYLIKDQFADIYLPEYGLILDVSATIPHLDEYQLRILSIPSNQLGTQITDFSQSLKNKIFPKLEYYRISKLYRDICIDTISYWISDKDIYQLLMMERLDDVSLQVMSFHSPILQVNSEKLIQNAA